MSQNLTQFVTNSPIWTFWFFDCFKEVCVEFLYMRSNSTVWLMTLLHLPCAFIPKNFVQDIQLTLAVDFPLQQSLTALTSHLWVTSLPGPHTSHTAEKSNVEKEGARRTRAATTQSPKTWVTMKSIEHQSFLTWLFHLFIARFSPTLTINLRIHQLIPQNVASTH